MIIVSSLVTYMLGSH